MTVNTLVAEGQSLGRSTAALDDINASAGSVLESLRVQGTSLKVSSPTYSL